MSKLLITKNGPEDWHVWITLPDHDAVLDSYGFIVGTGVTRTDAVAAAVADLEAAVAELQAPDGVVEERAL